jgi:hypothetical protein
MAHVFSKPPVWPPSLVGRVVAERERPLGRGQICLLRHRGKQLEGRRLEAPPPEHALCIHREILTILTHPSPLHLKGPPTGRVHFGMEQGGGGVVAPHSSGGGGAAAWTPVTRGRVPQPWGRASQRRGLKGRAALVQAALGQ